MEPLVLSFLRFGNLKAGDYVKKCPDPHYVTKTTKEEALGIVLASPIIFRYNVIPHKVVRIIVTDWEFYRKHMFKHSIIHTLRYNGFDWDDVPDML